MDRPTQEEVERALSFVQDTEYEGEPGHDYYGILAAEVRALRADLAEARRNAELFNDAHHAAELRIVELREAERQAAEFYAASAPDHGGAGLGVYEQAVKGRQDFRTAYRAAREALARVEALCHLQHEDSAVSIGDIRAALSGRGT